MPPPHVLLVEVLAPFNKKEDLICEFVIYIIHGGRGKRQAGVTYTRGIDIVGTIIYNGKA